MTNNNYQMGWDIGGAHLKAVLIAADGSLMQAIQLACPLWKGLDQLEIAIVEVLGQIKIEKNRLRHAVTMTGELVDLFENRRQGVIEIANIFVNIAGPQALFYAAQPDDRSFVSFNDVNQQAQWIASANWHASASLLARFQANALLIDIGSTTTDIVPIVNNRVFAAGAGPIGHTGFSDAKRMQQDSLVYTGVARTPVMALAASLTVDGVQTNVAAEYFATMADVYRLTGDLNPAFDLADTADGQPKTLVASAKRLARMVGHDVEDKPMTVWQQLAQTCKRLQLDRIKLAALKHYQPGMPLIGAGAGAFLVQSLAATLQCAYLDLADVLPLHEQANLEQCLPAFAVAILALEQQ